MTDEAPMNRDSERPGNMAPEDESDRLAIRQDGLDDRTRGRNDHSPDDKADSVDIDMTQSDETTSSEPDDDFLTGADKIAPVDIGPNTILGNKYRVIGQAGTTGRVWQAVDTVTHLRVAIKLVPPRFQTKQCIKQYNAFYTTVHSLHHKNICPLDYLGFDPQVGYYLVMHWMPETLTRFLADMRKQNRKATPELIRSIVAMLADALDYAHKQRVIHRDVKPANIVVTRNKRGAFDMAQLIDFGLGVSLDDIKDGEPKMSGGTPRYMAPEQWRHEEQDGRTDQFALAVVAYELYSGKRPFPGSTRPELEEAVLAREVEPIPNIPAYVNHALLKALSKKKEDRFDTCTRFAEALAPPVRFWTVPHLALVSFLVLAVIGLAGICVALLGPIGLVVDPGTGRGPARVPDANAYSFSMLPSKTTKAEGDVKTEGDVKADGDVKAEGDVKTDGDVKTKGDAKADSRSEPDSKTAKLAVDGKPCSVKDEASGPGWTYRFDEKKSLGTLALNNYNGAPIVASAIHLDVTLAPGSHNTIQAENGEAAIAVYGGNLSIARVDNTDPNTAQTSLSIVCSPVPREKRTSVAVAAIAVTGDTCALALGPMDELVVNARDTDGIHVAGKVAVDRVARIKIDSGRHNALYVGGDLSVTGSVADVHRLAGGLWLGGKYASFDIGKPDAASRDSIPTLYLQGHKVDKMVYDMTGLQEVFDAKAIGPKVVLVMADLESGPDKVTKRWTLRTDHGAFTVLSSGHRTIKRGDRHDPAQALWNISGDVTLGCSEGMGSSVLVIDGAASRAESARGSDKSDGSPASRKESVTVELNTQDGRKAVVHKYKTDHPSNVPLLCVGKTLGLHDGVVIRNCVNLAEQNEEHHGDGNAGMCSGAVCVRRNATFNMYGGRIEHCQASSGGAVGVAGTFNFYDGTLCENVAVDPNGFFSSEGGAVSVHKGVFRMAGGEIAGNAVLGNGTNMQSPDRCKGGAVYFGTEARGELVGGVIRDNISLASGGALYVGGSGSANVLISGDLFVRGNIAMAGAGVFMDSPVTMTGGCIEENSFFSGSSAILPAGSGIYLNSKFTNSSENQRFPCLTLYGRARVAPDNPIFVTSNKRSAGATLSGANHIPIRCGIFEGLPEQQFKVCAGQLAFDKSACSPLIDCGTSPGGRDVQNQVAACFSFGFVGIPENNQFQFVPYCRKYASGDPNAGKTVYYLAVTRK